MQFAKPTYASQPVYDPDDIYRQLYQYAQANPQFKYVPNAQTRMYDSTLSMLRQFQSQYPLLSGEQSAQSASAIKAAYDGFVDARNRGDQAAMDKFNADIIAAPKDARATIDPLISLLESTQQQMGRQFVDPSADASRARQSIVENNQAAQEAYQRMTGNGFTGGAINQNYSAPFGRMQNGTDISALPGARQLNSAGFQPIDLSFGGPQQTQGGWGGLGGLGGMQQQGGGWGGPWSNKNPWSPSQ